MLMKMFRSIPSSASEADFDRSGIPEFPRKVFSFFEKSHRNGLAIQAVNGAEGTDRLQLETFKQKIHFRSEGITPILYKMTDSNLQPNRTEQKFPFPSVTLCRLHSVPFRSAEKASINDPQAPHKFLGKMRVDNVDKKYVFGITRISQWDEIKNKTACVRDTDN
uniref:Uncharacterized protein n=1 Tax=Romanomermis culicivorax TaxID=13658 RepID=A0A915KMD1_ROMCU